MLLLNCRGFSAIKGNYLQSQWSEFIGEFVPIQVVCKFHKVLVITIKHVVQRSLYLGQKS